MDSNEKIVIKLDWKAILVGVVLVLVLGVALSYVIPGIGGVISIIVATAIAGYMARGHVMNGAIHGALVGAIEGIISLLIVFIKTGQMDSNVLMILLIVLIGDVSIGIIGGTIGNLIRMVTERNGESISE